MVIIATVSGSTIDARVVAEAASLADAFDDELHVLSVRSYESVEDWDDADAKKTVKEQATEAAAAAAAKVDRSAVTVGRIGQPAAEILAYADDVEARYIVIGGQKRSPVGKALFGSTTQKILLGADQSVVTVMASDKK